MSLVTQLTDLTTRLATEFRTHRTLMTGTSTGTLTGLTTTDKTSLVAAINEVQSEVGQGGATSLDELTDVVITSAATGDILRHNGTNWVDALGTTHYEVAGAAAAAQAAAEAASQPRDSDLTSIAALTTTAFGRGLLTLADAAALTDNVSASSETVAGKIEIATQAETNAGTDDARAITALKLQTRLAAFAQPLDSDLTSIAALTTTSYGRAFLELANQAALMALLSAASTTVQGIVELATDAEAVAGTDTARAVTAANVAAVLADRIDTNTALGSSNSKVPSQAAVKAYADALIGAANGMVFKGVIDASTNPNYPAADAGDVYRISVAGKIGGASGPNVEVGDIIMATADGVASGNHATVGASWNISQVNIDGAVIGPASSTSGNFTSFSGTSGKLVQDSGISLDTDGTLTANSNSRIPSQAAVRAYAQPLDSDLTSIASLTTTSYGRAFLELANQAGLSALLPVASETVVGIIEIATQAETNTGTDDTRAITPLKFQTRLAAYAQPLDTDLSAIAALTSAANKIPYATGAGTWALADFTAFGRDLVDSADAAAARSTLDVYSTTEIGDPATDFVAAFNTALTS